MSFKFFKFLTLFFLIFTIAFAKTKLVFVFSYNLKEKSVLDQYQGTLQALKDYGFENIEKKLFELNYRQSTKKSFKEKVKKVVSFINKNYPKVVFIYDDPALISLLPYLKGKNFFVVFSGINQKLSFYNKQFNLFDKHERPIDNVVGVLEPLFINELITTGIFVFGNQKKYPFLVSNDITGQAVLSQALDYLKNNPNYLKKTTIYTFSTLESYLSFLKDLNKKKNNKFSIHAVFKLRKSKNGYIGAPSIINITQKYYNKGLLGFADTWVELGLTLGVSCDFWDMGYKAGVLASKLLQGYPISLLKVQKENKKKIIINLNSFKKINKKIPLSLLFASDEIY
ncbi:MAG TPA: hypothetical protein EYH39_01215 [Desulfurobacteriaceae bacterium]|nr:hypothetical protein [Desulfurobacteriaceae bacterium]